MQCFAEGVNLISTLICGERVSYTPMENYISQGNFPQVNQTNTLTGRGTGSYTSPSPLSVISFLRCQGFTFGSALCPSPYTQDWLKILPAWATLVSRLSLSFMKPTCSSRPSLLLLRCKIISFLLAMTEAILPPEILSKCKCKNHLSGLLPQAHSPYFILPAPPFSTTLSTNCLPSF